MHPNTQNRIIMKHFQNTETKFTDNRIQGSTVSLSNKWSVLTNFNIPNQKRKAWTFNYRRTQSLLMPRGSVRDRYTSLSRAELRNIVWLKVTIVSLKMFPFISEMLVHVMRFSLYEQKSISLLAIGLKLIMA